MDARFLQVGSKSTLEIIFLYAIYKKQYGKLQMSTDWLYSSLAEDFVIESRKVSRLPFKTQGVLNCFNIILTTLNAVKFLDMKADL